MIISYILYISQVMGELSKETVIVQKDRVCFSSDKTLVTKGIITWAPYCLILLKHEVENPKSLTSCKKNEPN